MALSPGQHRDELAEIERRLAAGERDAALARRHRRLTRVIETSEALERAERHLREAEAMRADPEMAALAAEEEAKAREETGRLRAALEEMLRPRDPLDAQDVVLEIRAGTGGEEAALFAGDLLRMYTRFAEARGWRVEMLSRSETDLGGLKEVIAAVSGEGVYGVLKGESGTHRVQRVPRTEASGRIHTSTATVAVLPEDDDTIDVEIREEDLKTDVFRAGGRGGQHVNVTDSAVRITHLPTGLVVSCQDERSQHQNRAKGMRVLRARLLDRERQVRADSRAADRRRQVGTAQRAEKIRTYNVPQNRVTDHRSGLTVHDVAGVLAGGLDPLIEAMRNAPEP